MMDTEIDASPRATLTGNEAPRTVTFVTDNHYRRVRLTAHGQTWITQRRYKTKHGWRHYLRPATEAEAS